MPILRKISLPNVWEKQFDGSYEAAVELRTHICGECLNGKISFVGPDGSILTEDSDLIVDTEYDGKKYKCHDIATLLSTNCGLEFEYEEDADLY